MHRVTADPFPWGLFPLPHGRTASRRLIWELLPPAVRRLVADRLGSEVVETHSAGAGFTPGFASTVVGADGRRQFVKAASVKAQRRFAEAYSAEIATLRTLAGAGLPLPPLLWSHEDDLWVVLATEHVAGGPPTRPWLEEELAVCLDALAEVARHTTPPPPGLRLRPLTEELPDLLTGWDHVRATRPGWPHLAEAAALAASFTAYDGNDAFCHADARDDNFILPGDGTALLCDWNWPALGPRWLDAVDLLVSAHGDGLDADAVLAGHPLTRDAVPDHLDAWLALFCGFMLTARDRPVPSSSPWLRTHQDWYARASWSWLVARRGW